MPEQDTGKNPNPDGGGSISPLTDKETAKMVNGLLNRLSQREPEGVVLTLNWLQSSAECPHCKGALTKDTPILAADEEPTKGAADITEDRVTRVFDHRPKCPHCYGRFTLRFQI